MLLLLADCPGIRCSTSQCSTIFPFASSRKMSLPAQSLSFGHRWKQCTTTNSLCESPLEFDTLSWILACHPFEVLDECFLAISD
jgi:hypothetical protein